MGKLKAVHVDKLPAGKHFDGRGLYLRVTSAGSRRWAYRYTAGGKTRELGLGSYPEVGLAAARQAVDDIRAKVRAGEDPRPPPPPKPKTFTSAAAAYLWSHRSTWTRKHCSRWAFAIKTHARPVIGAKPVEDVTTEDLLRVLTPIWASRPAMAPKLRQYIERVLDYATVRKWRSGPNPAAWAGNLALVLPKPSRLHTVTHVPAIPWQEIPALWRELAQRGGYPALAVRWLILTAVRSQEAIGARWEEIDSENAKGPVWTVPGPRMKMKCEHKVPLPTQALDLLEVYSGDYLFPGRKHGTHVSADAVLKTVKALRPDATVHGLRSAFRDWAEEESGYPSRVAEYALAHRLESETERAYQRSDLLEKRRSLMQAWANFVTSDTAAGAVIPFRRRT